MTGYKLINISNLVKEMGEDAVKDVLSTFSSPRNVDIEFFLKDKAIEFSKHGIAATHLVFASHENETALIGYFALATKYITVSKKKLSNNMKKRVAKFGTYNEDMQGYTLAAPLIAQLGKNFKDKLNMLITGDELLKMACDKVKDAQENVGGRLVYVECEDTPALISFYESNGFVNFGKRELDKEEALQIQGKYLIQLIKYL